MTCGTYTITNKINGKWYAGQSPTIEKRWKQHIAGNGHAALLSNALKKYGADNFEFRIIEVCNNNKQELDAAEQRLLDQRPSYNLNYIANRVDMTPEVRSKLSLAGKVGKYFSQLGVKRSQETKDKISSNNIGNTNMLGHHHTEESKEKNRQAHLGKPSAWKGHKNTAGEKAAQTARQLGKPWSIKRCQAYLQSKEQS